MTTTKPTEEMARAVDSASCKAWPVTTTGSAECSASSTR